MRARLVRYLRAEHATHPWMLPGIAITASAALGTHLQALIDALRGWL